MSENSEDQSDPKPPFVLYKVYIEVNRKKGFISFYYCKGVSIDLEIDVHPMEGSGTEMLCPPNDTMDKIKSLHTANSNKDKVIKVHLVYSLFNGVSTVVLDFKSWMESRELVVKNVEMFDKDTMNLIMDWALKAEKLHFNSMQFPMDFHHEKAFSPKSVQYDGDCQWVKEEQLTSLRGKHSITLGRTTFGLTNIEKILEIWNSVDYNMFQELCFETKYPCLLMLDNQRSCTMNNVRIWNENEVPKEFNSEYGSRHFVIRSDSRNPERDQYAIIEFSNQGFHMKTYSREFLDENISLFKKFQLDDFIVEMKEYLESPGINQRNIEKLVLEFRKIEEEFDMIFQQQDSVNMIDDAQNCCERVASLKKEIVLSLHGSKLTPYQKYYWQRVLLDGCTEGVPSSNECVVNRERLSPDFLLNLPSTVQTNFLKLLPWPDIVKLASVSDEMEQVVKDCYRGSVPRRYEVDFDSLNDLGYAIWITFGEGRDRVRVAVTPVEIITGDDVIHNHDILHWCSEEHHCIKRSLKLIKKLHKLFTKDSEFPETVVNCNLMGDGVTMIINWPRYRDATKLTVRNRELSMEALDEIYKWADGRKELRFEQLELLPWSPDNEKAFSTPRITYGGDCEWVSASQLLSLRNKQNITLGKTTFGFGTMRFIIRSWMNSPVDIFESLQFETKHDNMRQVWREDRPVLVSLVYAEDGIEEFGFQPNGTPGVLHLLLYCPHYDKEQKFALVEISENGKFMIRFFSPNTLPNASAYPEPFQLVSRRQSLEMGIQAIQEMGDDINDLAEERLDTLEFERDEVDRTLRDMGVQDLDIW